MIHSALYIFLAVSLVNGSPNPAGWFSYISNSNHETLGHETFDHENDHQTPKDQLHRLANEADENVKDLNSIDSSYIDDFVQEIKKELKKSDRKGQQKVKIENSDDALTIEDVLQQIEKKHKNNDRKGQEIVKIENSDDAFTIEDVLQQIEKKHKNSDRKGQQKVKIENSDDAFTIEDFRKQIEEKFDEERNNKKEEEINVVNPNNPLPIEDLLQEIEDNSEKSNTQEKKEMLGVLEQLKNVVTDESKRQANILIKGFWHVVDLGIAGSSQRKRAAEKTDTLFDGFLRVLRSAYEWFWGLFGYDMKAKEEKNDEDNDKDGKNDGQDNDGDSDTDRKGKPKTVNKDSKPWPDKGDGKGGTQNPEEKDPKTDTSSNGRLVYDSDWKDSKELEKTMKNLNDLSVLLEGKLKTREEVDKELKEAQDNKDVHNRFYTQSEKFKKEREDAKDTRVWTEDAALKKLDEMNTEFDKTAHKKQMVKDILSLSMQPLYCVETYDKIMEMIERLKKSGVPETDLLDAEDSAFENILFSLTHLIQKTPRDQYQKAIHAAHEKISEEEKQKHGYPQKWTEEEVLKKLHEVEKNFATADKPTMVKDVTTMCMQPFLHIDTYDKIFDAVKKLKDEAKVPEHDVQIAENALKRESRFVLIENLLIKPAVSDQQLYKLQTEKAKEKRVKHNDTREFTEDQALKRIDEMNTHFDSIDKNVMVKDVTSLSMQPLYHIETYDKMYDFMDKMKKNKGVTEEELKPAAESLKQETEFAVEHDLQRTRQGSIAAHLHEMKLQYVKPTPLSTEEKYELLENLEILQGRNDLTEHETKSAKKLVQLLMGDDFVTERGKVGALYQTIVQNEKKFDPKINVSNLHAKNVNPADFKAGKFVGNTVVAA